MASAGDSGSGSYDEILERLLAGDPVDVDSEIDSSATLTAEQKRAARALARAIEPGAAAVPAAPDASSLRARRSASSGSCDASAREHRDGLPRRAALARRARRGQDPAARASRSRPKRTRACRARPRRSRDCGTRASSRRSRTGRTTASTTSRWSTSRAAGSTRSSPTRARAESRPTVAPGHRLVPRRRARPPGRARGRDHPPRRQAVEHPHHAGRAGPCSLDFGLALDRPDSTLTTAGAFRGSPRYSSPEQIDPRDREIDAPDRRLLARRHALRGDHASAAVRGADDRGRLRAHPRRRRRSAAPQDRARDSPRGRDGHPRPRSSATASVATRRAAAFARDLDALLELARHPRAPARAWRGACGSGSGGGRLAAALVGAMILALLAGGSVFAARAVPRGVRSRGRPRPRPRQPAARSTTPSPRGTARWAWPRRATSRSGRAATLGCGTRRARRPCCPRRASS